MRIKEVYDLNNYDSRVKIKQLTSAMNREKYSLLNRMFNNKIRMYDNTEWLLLQIMDTINCV
jgi:hypothetical protein